MEGLGDAAGLLESSSWMDLAKLCGFLHKVRIQGFQRPHFDQMEDLFKRLQSFPNPETLLNEEFFKALATLYDNLVTGDLSRPEVVSLNLQLLFVVEDLSEVPLGKALCGKHFITRLLALISAKSGSFKLKRASVETLCALITRSAENQKFLVVHSSGCYKLFKVFLPRCGDFQLQASAAEILFRLTRKHRRLLDVIEDAAARKAMLEMHEMKQPNLISDIRNFVELLNKSLGASRNVHSFRTLEAVFDQEPAHKEIWVHLGSDQLSYYTTSTSGSMEIIDLAYKDIKEIKHDSLSLLDLVICKTNGREVVFTKHTLRFRFTSEDLLEAYNCCMAKVAIVNAAAQPSTPQIGKSSIGIHAPLPKSSDFPAVIEERRESATANVTQLRSKLMAMLDPGKKARDYAEKTTSVHENLPKKLNDIKTDDEPDDTAVIPVEVPKKAVGGNEDGFSRGGTGNKKTDVLQEQMVQSRLAKQTRIEAPVSGQPAKKAKTLLVTEEVLKEEAADTSGPEVIETTSPSAVLAKHSEKAVDNDENGLGPAGTGDAERSVKQQKVQTGIQDSGRPTVVSIEEPAETLAPEVVETGKTSEARVKAPTEGRSKERKVQSRVTKQRLSFLISRQRRQVNAQLLRKYFQAEDGNGAQSMQQKVQTRSAKQTRISASAVSERVPKMGEQAGEVEPERAAEVAPDHSGVTPKVLEPHFDAALSRRVAQAPEKARSKRRQVQKEPPARSPRKNSDAVEIRADQVFDFDQPEETSGNKHAGKTEMWNGGSRSKRRKIRKELPISTTRKNSAEAVEIRIDEAFGFDDQLEKMSGKDKAPARNRNPPVSLPKASVIETSIEDLDSPQSSPFPWNHAPEKEAAPEASNFPKLHKAKVEESEEAPDSPGFPIPIEEDVVSPLCFEEQTSKFSRLHAVDEAKEDPVIHDDSATDVLVLFTNLLKKFKQKVKAKVQARSMQIITSTSEAIKSEAASVELQIQKDVEAYVQQCRSKLGHVELQLQDENSRFKGICEGFEREIKQHCERLDQVQSEIEGTEDELKALSDKQKVAHRKWITQMQKTSEDRIKGAESRIVAVKKAAKRMEGLREVFHQLCDNL